MNSPDRRNLSQYNGGGWTGSAAGGAASGAGSGVGTGDTEEGTTGDSGTSLGETAMGTTDSVEEMEIGETDRDDSEGGTSNTCERVIVRLWMRGTTALVEGDSSIGGIASSCLTRLEGLCGLGDLEDLTGLP